MSAVKSKTSLVPEREFSAQELVIIEAMIESGVLHGRKHSKTNPKMNKFIWGTKKGIDIFDLSQTVELLDKATSFLGELKEKNLPILVVGGKLATKDIVRDFAEKFDFSYVTERWLGGTLTNFKTIHKRVEHLKKLRDDKKSGDWDKYTKKERLDLSREIDKLELLFSGVENLEQLPAALIIIDTEEHKTAVREANRLKIPIVGLINTDGNPDEIQYPVPANDNSRMSVSWILAKIEEDLKIVK